MKITKRQLRRIIKEESQKLQEQRDEPDYALLQVIEKYASTLEKDLDAKMSVENRIWYEHPEHKKAIAEMLDGVKRYFAEYGERA